MWIFGGFVVVFSFSYNLVLHYQSLPYFIRIRIKSLFNLTWGYFITVKKPSLFWKMLYMWQLNFRFLFPKMESVILTGCGGTTENLVYSMFLLGIILTNMMFYPYTHHLGLEGAIWDGDLKQHTHTSFDPRIIFFQTS